MRPVIVARVVPSRFVAVTDAAAPERAGPYRVPPRTFTNPWYLAEVPESGLTPEGFKTVTVAESIHEWTMKVPLLPEFWNSTKSRAVGV